eukprot:gene10783-2867_t
MKEVQEIHENAQLLTEYPQVEANTGVNDHPIEIGAEIVVDLGALVNERQASKVEMVAEVRVKVQVDMAAAAPANLLEEKPKVVRQEIDAAIEVEGQKGCGRDRDIDRDRSGSQEAKRSGGQEEHLLTSADCIHGCLCLAKANQAYIHNFRQTHAAPNHKHMRTVTDTLLLNVRWCCIHSALPRTTAAAASSSGARGRLHLFRLFAHHPHPGQICPKRRGGGDNCGRPVCPVLGNRACQVPMQGDETFME